MSETIRSPRRFRLPIAFFAIAFVSVALNAQTIYVKADASGANDGSSWANAYTDLQSALAVTSTQRERT